MTVRQLVKILNQFPPEARVKAFDNYDEGNSSEEIAGAALNPENGEVTVFGTPPLWVRSPKRVGLKDVLVYGWARTGRTHNTGGSR